MSNLSTTFGVVVVGVNDSPAPRGEREIGTAVCLWAIYSLLHLRRSVEIIVRILNVCLKVRIYRTRMLLRLITPSAFPWFALSFVTFGHNSCTTCCTTGHGALVTMPPPSSRRMEPRHHALSLPICGREGQPHREETLLEDVHFDVADLGPVRRRHEVMAECCKHSFLLHEAGLPRGVANLLGILWGVALCMTVDYAPAVDCPWSAYSSVSSPISRCCGLLLVPSCRYNRPVGLGTCVSWNIYS